MGMHDIAAAVRAAPGLVGLEYTRQYITAGNQFSRRYGYAALHRAADHGLIHSHPGPRRGWWLWFPGEDCAACEEGSV